MRRPNAAALKFNCERSSLCSFGDMLGNTCQQGSNGRIVVACCSYTTTVLVAGRVFQAAAGHLQENPTNDRHPQTILGDNTAFGRLTPALNQSPLRDAIYRSSSRRGSNWSST